MLDVCFVYGNVDYSAGCELAEPSIGKFREQRPRIATDPFEDHATIFTTRSREVHSRKRKLIAHTFSQKSVVDFEPVVKKYNRILVRHWDRMCAAATKGESGVVGETVWKAESGVAIMDCLLCKLSYH